MGATAEDQEMAAAVEDQEMAATVEDQERAATVEDLSECNGRAIFNSSVRQTIEKCCSWRL